ncbi:MAG: pyruvate ferredoxin oxidoreductase [Thermoplasmata archaeon]|nr:pyruvate ferredoxin oxidoreductase [Thermoplasmata archaeon]
MTTKRVVTGNYAAAYGALLSRIQFSAAYPITPQTFIVEHLSEFVNDGILDAEFMRTESEHSAMSAVVAAEATGVRSFTATSSQGLALMHEVLFLPSALRLPVVMPVVNRTVAAPIGIWCEYNDTMPQRDTGWMQAYVEDNQEVLDMVIQAYRIAEHKDVLLPMMLSMDAFILSHTVEPVEFPNQDDVDDFLPPYKAEHAHLWPEDPMIIGSFTPPEYIQEVRYQTDQAMHAARDVIKEVTKEFGKKFGRDYGGLVEEYRMDDAEVALVSLGTVTSTARDVVDELREEGKKVGLVKLRYFRPYPYEEIRKVAEQVSAIGFYDRSISYGSGGPNYIEGRHALYGLDIPVMNFLAGLGGRDVTVPDIRLMYEKLLEAAKEGKAMKEIIWIGTRGVEP